MNNAGSLPPKARMKERSSINYGDLKKYGCTDFCSVYLSKVRQCTPVLGTPCHNDKQDNLYLDSIVASILNSPAFEQPRAIISEKGGTSA
jgi:hypothetical protein